MDTCGQKLTSIQGKPLHYYEVLGIMDDILHPSNYGKMVKCMEKKLVQLYKRCVFPVRLEMRFIVGEAGLE